MSSLVKICGITRIVDAIASADAGADFIGLVFADGSPRRVDLDSAARIAEATRRHSPKVRIVGVFRDSPVATVRLTASYVGLDLVQLHGNEEECAIREIGVPSIKALRVGSELPSAAPFVSAQWILYDTMSLVAPGGTGEVFDWSLLTERSDSRPFFLAGGLTPDNVRAAVDSAHPDAIDVSSGVERTPGIKDHHEIARLVRAVR